MDALALAGLLFAGLLDEELGLRALNILRKRKNVRKCGRYFLTCPDPLSRLRCSLLAVYRRVGLVILDAPTGLDSRVRLAATLLRPRAIHVRRELCAQRRCVLVPPRKTFRVLYEYQNP